MEVIVHTIISLKCTESFLSNGFEVYVPWMKAIVDIWTSKALQTTFISIEIYKDFSPMSGLMPISFVMHESILIHQYYAASQRP